MQEDQFISENTIDSQLIEYFRDYNQIHILEILKKSPEWLLDATVRHHIQLFLFSLSKIEDDASFKASDNNNNHDQSDFNKLRNDVHWNGSPLYDMTDLSQQFGPLSYTIKHDPHVIQEIIKYLCQISSKVNS